MNFKIYPEEKNDQDDYSTYMEEKIKSRMLDLISSVIINSSLIKNEDNRRGIDDGTNKY